MSGAIPVEAESESESGSESEAVAAVRELVSTLHAELPRQGLVVWTAGNISGRVPGEDLFVIKPSGVSFDELSPESMVLCDLDGVPVPGSMAW